MTSDLALAKANARHGITTWDGGQMFEGYRSYDDAVNVLTADAARTAASGGVDIATTGVATFAADQSAIIAAGDYITVLRGGVPVKFLVVSGATTTWQLSPAPTTAYGVGNVTIVDDGSTSTSTFATAPGFAVGDKFITATGGVEYTVTAVVSTTVFTTTPDTAAASQAYGISYLPYNAASYVDFPSVAQVGARPIPEEFRMRFGGTGTLSGTYQFVRVNALTGVETAITTAVATTAAAVWQGVAAVATAQLPFTASNTVDGVAQEFPVDEFIRLVLTARTTTTTGRTLLVEMGFRQKRGATNFSGI